MPSEVRILRLSFTFRLKFFAISTGTKIPSERSFNSFQLPSVIYLLVLNTLFSFTTSTPETEPLTLFPAFLKKTLIFNWVVIAVISFWDFSASKMVLEFLIPSVYLIILALCKISKEYFNENWWKFNKNIKVWKLKKL